MRPIVEYLLLKKVTVDDAPDPGFGTRIGKELDSPKVPFKLQYSIDYPNLQYCTVVSYCRKICR